MVPEPLAKQFSQVQTLLEHRTGLFRRIIIGGVVSAIFAAGLFAMTLVLAFRVADLSNQSHTIGCESERSRQTQQVIAEIVVAAVRRDEPGINRLTNQIDRLAHAPDRCVR